MGLILVLHLLYINNLLFLRVSSVIFQNLFLGTNPSNRHLGQIIKKVKISFSI